MNHGLCVLRSQLPQNNEFYPANPPDPDDEEDRLEANPDLMTAAEADAASRMAAARCDERTMSIVNPKFSFPEHEVVTDLEVNCKAESDARVMAAAGIDASTTSLNAEEGEITAADAAEAMASLSTKAKGQQGKAGEQGHQNGVRERPNHVEVSDGHRNCQRSDHALREVEAKRTSLGRIITEQWRCAAAALVVRRRASM